MRIELSEVLICPDCGPDANLVLAVDEQEGRWVRAGTLACARCDARYPVRAGSVDFGSAEPAGVPEETGVPDGGLADPDEVAVEVAALLGLDRRTGAVLLGPGLAPAAPRVAALAERSEILALAPGGGSPEEAGGERLTWLRGHPGGRLPVRGRRLAGLALWSPDADRVEEAAEALGTGGRLAGLRPGPEARRRAEELGLEVLVSEVRAFVASRPS